VYEDDGQIKIEFFQRMLISRPAVVAFPYRRMPEIYVVAGSEISGNEESRSAGDKTRNV